MGPGIPLEFVIKEVENELRKKGYIKIKLSEVEEWFPVYRGILEKIHKIFFRDWEVLETPFQVSRNLKNIISFLSPLFEELKAEKEDWHSILLRNYLYTLETKILPIFEEESYFKDKKFSKGILLEILEYLLKEETIPFIGDPLKGLQIMGFLETRLLSFKKLIILDVNEGYLPPAPSFNPLLTDEIKHYLGIPVYKNELWVYYFERLIKSAAEVHLLYLFVEKSKTQEFREPSRFIQKLKWEIEREGKEPEEKIVNLNFSILSKKEGIPKTEKDRAYLLRLLQDIEISRYFLESYLKCGVYFYFKYLLKLEKPKGIGLEIADVGNFLHQFFKDLFKHLEGKTYLVKELWEKENPLKKLEDLWEKYKFSRKMNTLSHFFSKKIAKESIKKYFEYLIKLEESAKVKHSKVLGVEKSLVLNESFKLYHSLENFSGSNLNIRLKGIADFIIKREEGIPKYLILDYKSNPYMSPAPNKAKEMITFKVKLSDTFDRDSIYEVADAFGTKLSNFQLLFYYYLFYHQKDFFIEEPRGSFYIINAGFITPSNLETPEKFVFNAKPKDWSKIYNYFQKDFKSLLEWIINHLIFSDAFYFAIDESTCKFCEYQAPCKNFKYLL